MSFSPLKIISLNIEADKHYETVVPFLKKEQADIVCLQEVPEEGLLFLKEALGYTNTYYARMTVIETEETSITIGHAIMTSLPCHLLQKAYYFGEEREKDTLPRLVFGGLSNTVYKALTVVEVTKDTIPYTIGNTHFTWTKNGEIDEYQKRDAIGLMKALDKHSEIVLCGDFNAPRGREMWARLTKRYNDNIPPHITNTLDPTLHRAPDVVYVVDGMFSTQGYNVTNVKVQGGISDHCAIIGSVSVK